MFLLLSFVFAADLRADDAPKDDGFVALFNGVDLKGWVGDTDGYKAVNGVLICQAGKGKGGKSIRPRNMLTLSFNSNSS